MQINYTVETKKYILQKGAIVYDLLKRKYWKLFRIGIIIALVLFFIDYTVDFNIKSTLTTSEIKDKVTYTDMHLSKSLALIISIILCYLLFLIYSGKDTLLKKINEKAALFSCDTFISINEEIISLKNSLSETKLKWALIESFKIHERYLLMRVNGIDAAIVIDTAIIKKEEYDFLLNLLSENKILKN